MLELKLTNFKNYEYQTLAFSPRLNLITGLNGMGKTNLLDAVYYLCMGKSHFGTNDKFVVRQGDSFFRLEGRFLLNEKVEKVVAKVVPGKQKTLERNDIPYPKIGDHVGLLPVVFLAPDDTALALEGSEERRRFLDNTLCQLDRDYLERLVTYNKVLQNRNALLRQFAESRTFNPALLDAFDEQMIAPAAYIFQKRQEFTRRFAPVAKESYLAICGDAEQVAFEYRSQLTDDNLTRLLRESVEKDRLLQRTTAGIHKDDLVFYMNGSPLKRFASQGQLKSFVLSLKLAQHECLRREKGSCPILLLDDLFDKLDDQRASQLIGLLVNGNCGQVFISDTHPRRAEDIAKSFGNEYKKFIIADGAVVAE